MSHAHASNGLGCRWCRWGSVPVLLILSLGTPIAAAAGSLTLAWDSSPDPDVASYIVEWGGSAGVYTNQVNVGNVTSHTIEGLVDGQSYHVVVRSRTVDGATSAASNEAVGVASTAGGGVPTPDPDPDPDPDPGPSPEPDPEPDPQPDPVPGPAQSLVADLDFDGDSAADLGVYRPSTGEWKVRGSSGLELIVKGGAKLDHRGGGKLDH